MEGIPLEFIGCPPTQCHLPREYKFNVKDKEAISAEVSKLLNRGIVSEIREGWEFVSNIFVRPKPNNKIRLIIDLSPLNIHIKKEHFKMDNLQSAIDMMSKGAFMASIDLQDAYYTLPIAEQFKPYMCFQWNEKIYMFHVMPFGLTSAPRFFTKVMKPPLAVLRQKGVRLFNYIDDIFIIADTHDDCVLSLKLTEEMLMSLGFYINREKSCFLPSSKMRFLGFMLDTQSMKVYPPEEKVEKTLDFITEFLRPEKYIIRAVASLVGTLNDLSHGMDYAGAHIKGLEICKNQALVFAGEEGFQGMMYLSTEAINDLYWWIRNIRGSQRKIRVSVPEIVFQTDASMKGWGGVCEEKVVNGRWKGQEQYLHINALEMLAVFNTLTHLFGGLTGVHFKVQSDNTTTVTYINKEGGTYSFACNKFTQMIWDWCQQRDSWISATFIPGKSNREADFASRHFTGDTEWGINPLIFKAICHHWFKPTVDLFASSSNHMLTKYVSWGPDEGAIACDAFLLDWSTFDSVYVFPPFRLATRCLQKIKAEKPTGIIVVPTWPGQLWFSMLQTVSIGEPLLFRRKPNNIIPKSPQNLSSNLHSIPLTCVRF